MLDNPSQIPSFLAEALPSQAVFFICYIMLATLTGYALQLLRVVPLILVAIKRKWLVKTPREEALAWKPPPVLYDRVVSYWYLYLSYMWSFHDLRYGLVSQSLFMMYVHDSRFSRACLRGIQNHDLWTNRFIYPRSRIHDAEPTIYDLLPTVDDLWTAIRNSLSAKRDTRHEIHVPLSVIRDPRSTTRDPKI